MAIVLFVITVNHYSFRKFMKLPALRNTSFCWINLNNNVLMWKGSRAFLKHSCCSLEIHYFLHISSQPMPLTCLFAVWWCNAYPAVIQRKGKRKCKDTELLNKEVSPSVSDLISRNYSPSPVSRPHNLFTSTGEQNIVSWLSAQIIYQFSNFAKTEKCFTSDQ